VQHSGGQEMGGLAGGSHIAEAAPYWWSLSVLPLQVHKLDGLVTPVRAAARAVILPARWARQVHQFNLLVG
jgi:hypothetical protein